jgi:non-specific serine/threonine protein kinase
MPSLMASGGSNLAPLTDSTLVPQTVAAVLEVREQPGQPLTELLAGVLRPKQLLLVLDNCEHLVHAAAQFAEAVLRAGPELTILATSREPLHVQGEINWGVPSLAVPDPRLSPHFEEIAQSPAVRLFVGFSCIGVG